MFDLADGKQLIELAKLSINSYLFNTKLEISEQIKKRYSEKHGVFVTLHKDNKLRGCIGFPKPNFKLYKAIIDAARSAAFEDLRFSPVTKEESKFLKYEISILTKPKKIEVKDASEYLEKIDVGHDGLIIKSAFYSGLLLPQVAKEQNWSIREFLNNLCLKAGLEKNAWLDLNNEIFKFQAQVFKEFNNKIIEEY